MEREKYENKSDNERLYDMQLSALKNISNSVINASRKFDVDANKDDSELDRMV